MNNDNICNAHHTHTPSRRPGRKCLDPVKRRLHRTHQAERKARDDRSMAGSSVAFLHALSAGLRSPDKFERIATAQRLMSEYSRAQLGDRLYIRCHRLLHPVHDPIRHKIAPGKPGKLNEMEQREYDLRRCALQILEIIEADTPAPVTAPASI
jgi:hypothetical protein